MLIPIDEIYFKEKVKIKFDNIIQGFNNYKNKTIKAIDNKDFENKMLGFLKEAALLNNIDNSFVDFYYNFLVLFYRTIKRIRMKDHSDSF